MIYTLENDLIRVQVSDLGAELQSMVLRETNDEYIWQGDPAVWNKRAPLLFPFVGRLKGDAYEFGGRTYPMKKHGFAMGSTFEVRQESADRLTMTLTGSADNEGYPFDFVLEVAYQLEGGSLRVTHRVTNRGEGDMYFSLGAHPGFRCDMGDWLQFADDETAQAHRLTDDKLLTERPVEQGIADHRLTVTKDIFANDALIFDGLRSDRATLYCGGRPRVTVAFGSAPCLGVWAKPAAKYVCIEPWFGIDDSDQATGRLTEKKHIQRLAPGRTFRFPVTIEPHR